MRMLFASMALALVGACGGEDDVTNPPPPAGQTHTLTVSGTGEGSGRVVTASGTSPALDCALAANGQSSGTCSADYAEGSTVALSLSADEGSTFTGWSGDGESCATAATCSIDMSASKTVVAGFSVAPAPAGEVEVISSAWYPNPEFELIDWVVEVRNNTERIVEVAQINIEIQDAGGKVVASDFTFVGPIPPGETRAHDGFADYHGTEATANFTVEDVQYTTEDQSLGLAQIVSSNWHPDPNAGEVGGVVWTVEVQNTGTTELETVEVDFVTYDANGKILDYDFTLLGPIAPGARAAAEGLADLRGGETSANFQIEEVTAEDNLEVSRR